MKKKVLILFLFLLVQPIHAEDNLYKTIQIAYPVSVAIDLSSGWTMRPGFQEGNPVLGKTKAQQIGMSVVLVFTTLHCSKILKQKHPFWSKLILCAGIGAHGFAAGYNWSR
jgi:hypothetical protein